MDAWQIGMFTVYPFGLVLAVCAVPAFAWMAWEMRRAGLKQGTASWMAVLTVPLAFVMSRLCFCILILDEILGLQDAGLILRFQEGGYLLWGALFGGLLAAALTGKITGQGFGKVADCVLGPACFMILVGSIAGGLLVEQGIGLDLASWFDPEETDFTARFSVWMLKDYSFFERFPFAVRNYYDEWCWAVFMLVALWILVVFLILRKTEAAPGGRTVLFLLLYSVGQILFEGMLRGEVVHLPYLGFVRANQIICAAVILVIWGICLKAVPAKERKGAGLKSFLQILLAVLIVVAMEFAAFEKKITLIAWLPADACHLLTAAACVWMFFAVLPLWKRMYAQNGNA